MLKISESIKASTSYFDMAIAVPGNRNDPLHGNAIAPVN